MTDAGSAFEAWHSREHKHGLCVLKCEDAYKQGAAAQREAIAERLTANATAIRNMATKFVRDSLQMSIALAKAEALEDQASAIRGQRT